MATDSFSFVCSEPERDSIALQPSVNRPLNAVSADSSKKQGLFHGCKVQIRTIQKSHLKGVVIVLFWSFIVWGVLWDSSLGLSLTESKTLSTNIGHLRHDHNVDIFLLTHYIILFVVCLIGTPLAGWLADGRIGRYRVLQLSLWLLFFGLLIRALENLVYDYHYSDPHKRTPDEPERSLLLVVHCIGSVFHWSGVFGFLANNVQFGIDQMPDGSTTEVSAFIYWYVFTINIGIWASKSTILLAQTCGVKYPDSVIVILTFVPAFSVASALLLNFFFKKHLTIEPQTTNPFKLIAGVLKFAATHKKPRIRSALTYMDERLTRLDHGKSQYGGPFTTEQVEDVKTFLRLLLLALPAPLIIIAIYFAYYAVTALPQHYSEESCQHTVIKSFLYEHNLLVALCILLYEFVLYPLLRRTFTRMLRRILGSAGIACILMVLLFITDIVAHEMGLGVQNGTCILNNTYMIFNNSNNWSESETMFFYSMEISANAILAVTMTLLTIAAIEFVYAQSPYAMRGIMMGTTWFTFVVSIMIGDGIINLWKNKWTENNSRSMALTLCDILFYSFALCLAVTGLVLFGLTSYCYKNRVRNPDEVRNETAVIEQVYASRCAIESSGNM